MKETGDNKTVVITIGRQFGSGGREIGRKIADVLGIGYYDRELLTEASKSAGVVEELFERNDERAPSYLNGLFSFAHGMTPPNIYSGSTSISHDTIHRSKTDVISRIAERESCVIVGRTADYVLRDHPRHVSIFVHAPMEHCIDRITARDGSLSREKARAKAEKTNRLRANYYNFYTDKKWGAASSYDLTFDTSLLPQEDIVAIVKDYVRRRFPEIFS
ncbi:MAG: cytidylate kinase-like family protein [Paramuribaculum sp.]|nr:cytidylate kinase-like family protein [Paramuribaculum sp.]